jgi:hypothetical protein
MLQSCRCRFFVATCSHRRITTIILLERPKFTVTCMMLQTPTNIIMKPSMLPWFCSYITQLHQERKGNWLIRPLAYTYMYYMYIHVSTTRARIYPNPTNIYFHFNVLFRVVPDVFFARILTFPSIGLKISTVISSWCRRTRILDRRFAYHYFRDPTFF